jgi:hypothetical protein
MKLVLQPSRQLSWMQLLEDVLFSIGKYRAMKLKSFCLISSLVLYLKKVVLLLVLNIPRLKSTRHGCLYAEGNMLYMSKRQV